MILRRRTINVTFSPTPMSHLSFSFCFPLCLSDCVSCSWELGFLSPSLTTPPEKLMRGCPTLYSASSPPLLRHISPGGPRATPALSLPSPRPHQKLYNPNANTIPMHHGHSGPFHKRGQSHLSPCPTSLSRTQQHSPQHGNMSRHQSCNCRKDNPARPSNAAGPTDSSSQTAKPPTPSPQSSMDYVSAHSTTSDVQSTSSSNFTLSTNGPSTLSASFDDTPRSGTTGTVPATQLKRLYCDIYVLEGEVSREDSDEAVEEPGVMRGGRERKSVGPERGKRVLQHHEK